MPAGLHHGEQQYTAEQLAHWRQLQRAARGADGGSDLSDDQPDDLAPGGRIFCVSDIHTDHEVNMRWCQGLARDGKYKRDALIVAGDATASKPLLEETFRHLQAAFAAVFFVVGNHDLWTKGRGTEGWHPSRNDSVKRLQDILRLCEGMGVMTKPACAGGAIIAPIVSWHHQSWDTEPDITGWKDIPPAELCMMDYHLNVWPAPLDQKTDSVAAYMDGVNDSANDLEATVRALRTALPQAPLISFSHFVPHLALNPEKRYLNFPYLSKASGSTFLAQRIAALSPAAHVFGHTHFGWDATLEDGTRYVQAPLAYPEERDRMTGLTGEKMPKTGPQEPLLLFDAAHGGFPPRYEAAWSNFYAKYPRRPDLTHMLPHYVADLYSRIPNQGEVGWIGRNARDLEGKPMDGPHGDAKPPIALGPNWPSHHFAENTAWVEHTKETYGRVA